MGSCCSKPPPSQYKHGRGGYMQNGAMPERENKRGDNPIIGVGEHGSIVRVHGASRYTSMFIQQGRKGTNQDAMTVWENFAGEKDMIFCGVFDGHGPSGHKIANHVRDVLPSKLFTAIRRSQLNNSISGDSGVAKANGDYNDVYLSLWESCLIKAFKEMDEQVCHDPMLDCFCSGTTAVTVIKRSEHLIISNLGDSRAVLCTRGNKNQLVPVQLTVDLKPSVASEAERIKDSRGRVFALDVEPDVMRIWMPDEDYPGLAMSRAFGDFCLKEHGLISTPDLSYRKLTSDDEFVVLATDGVWDVLSNNEVIRIVASAKKRSSAAQLLVNRAVKAWKVKYPGSKIDDCAVICLFLKDRPFLAKSLSDVYMGKKDGPRLTISRSLRSVKSEGDREGPIQMIVESKEEEWSTVGGVSRVNSLVSVPKTNKNAARRRPNTGKDSKGIEAQWR